MSDDDEKKGKTEPKPKQQSKLEAILSKAATKVPEPSKEDEQPALKDDPEYVKCFKMTKLGLAEHSVVRAGR